MDVVFFTLKYTVLKKLIGQSFAKLVDIGVETSSTSYLDVKRG